MSKDLDIREKLQSEIDDLKGRLAEAVAVAENYEQQLKKTTQLKNQMEFVLGATKTGIDIIDADYNMLYIDPEWQKIYGEFNGRKCYEYFMGRSSPCPGCGATEAIKNKQSVISEETLSKEYGRPIQVTTIPLQNDDGSWVVAEVNIDISRRKGFEKALRSSEERFRNLAANAKDAIILMDNEGKISYWNPAAELIFGYKSDEVLGRDLHDLLAPKGYHEAYHLGFLKFKDSGKGPVIGKTQELTALRKDGTEFPIELSVSVFHTSLGWSATGIIRDISARRQVELELESHRKHLEELVKERTSLLEQREEELKERMSDLERFNKLAVGRELKMVELKEKIRELEMRLAIKTEK